MKAKVDTFNKENDQVGTVSVIVKLSFPALVTQHTYAVQGHFWFVVSLTDTPLVPSSNA